MRLIADSLKKPANAKRIPTESQWQPTRNLSKNAKCECACTRGSCGNDARPTRAYSPFVNEPQRGERTRLNFTTRRCGRTRVLFLGSWRRVASRAPAATIHRSLIVRQRSLFCTVVDALAIPVLSARRGHREANASRSFQSFSISTSKRFTHVVPWPPDTSLPSSQQAIQSSAETSRCAKR
jgi:hypothetical protein